MAKMVPVSNLSKDCAFLVRVAQSQPPSPITASHTFVSTQTSSQSNNTVRCRSHATSLVRMPDRTMKYRCDDHEGMISDHEMGEVITEVSEVVALRESGE